MQVPIQHSVRTNIRFTFVEELVKSFQPQDAKLCIWHCFAKPIQQTDV